MRNELLTRGWSTDFQRLPAVDVALLADARVTLPALQERCAALIGESSSRRQAVEARRAAWAEQAKTDERAKVAVEILDTVRVTTQGSNLLIRGQVSFETLGKILQNLPMP